MPPPRVDDEAPMPPEDNGIDSSGPRRSSSGSTAATYNNAEKSGAISGQGGVVSNQIAGQQKATVGALLKNPLAGMTDAQIIADADRFVEEKGLTEHREAFRKGAMLARVQNNDTAFEQLDIITEQEKETLRKEVKNRWHQPFMLYFLCSLCAGSAIVQGMDQTAVNGAQVRGATWAL